MKINAVPSFNGIFSNIKNRRIEKAKRQEAFEAQRQNMIDDIVLGMLPQFSSGEADIVIINYNKDKNGNLHMNVNVKKELEIPTTDEMADEYSMKMLERYNSQTTVPQFSNTDMDLNPSSEI